MKCPPPHLAWCLASDVCELQVRKTLRGLYDENRIGLLETISLRSRQDPQQPRSRQNAIPYEWATVFRGPFT